tara:strand:- start:331 stop:594 length:264 start_codon:yes stop_codon:yes gene_type:complete
MINRLLLIIFCLLFVANCSSYKPLINPESSKDKHNGNVIAGNYWKDLQACRYIHSQNTARIIKTLGISDETIFVKKCMNDYGYSILR